MWLVRSRRAIALLVLSLATGGAQLATLSPGEAAPVQAASGQASQDYVDIPPIAVPRSRMPPNPIPAILKVPAGKGPFPAVIVLHGCGGRSGSQLLWANRLNEWGYAALVPDSLTPRGVATVCQPGLQPLVTGRDRVGDIGSAAAWLRTQPAIDPARIAVLGQSHGGSTAALSVQSIYASIGLRAAIDYYGGCSEPAMQGDVPLLVLAGEADDWGNPAARCRAYAAQVLPGHVAEVHIYPGVYHAFEYPSAERRYSVGHIMEYNRAAAEDSFVQVHAFLDRWVRR
jgi:dienelactone hydrolase